MSSADPTSMAALPKATTKAKIKANSGGVDGDTSASESANGPEDPHEELKFRSTDEFVAGLTAALISTTSLFPINKLIFRQMASGQRAHTAAGYMREDGLRYLYRGILPPLIQKMVSVSIMFGSYGHYRKWADSRFSTSPPIANLILSSVLTGTTEAVLTPLERVQMLLQDRTYHKNYSNTVDALIKLRKFGVPEYYRGLTCVLVRNGPSNILFFGLRDKIKDYIPGYHAGGKSTSLVTPQQHRSQFTTLKSGHDHLSSHKSMLYDFLSGAILGMCISTLFYPLSVVRTRMQTRAPGTEFLSIVKAFNQVYVERDRKFTKLFRGCSINVIRQFVSWGLINCSHEFVLNQLHSIR